MPLSGYQHPPGFGYPGPPPPPLAPNGQRLAEFSDRLVARIIDVAILSGVTLVVVLPIYLVAVFALIRDLETVTTIDGQRSGEPAPFDGPAFVEFFLPIIGIVIFLLLLSLLLAYLYDAEMMFRSGQTFGKRIMKIRVIPLDPAQTLTRGMAFKRFLVQHAAVMFVPFLQWIDGLWQLWDKPYRQCLHDKFATTVVIKLGPGA